MTLNTRSLPPRAAARGKILAPLAVFAVALTLIPGGSAAAARKPAGGVVHIYETVPSLSSSYADDILTGAITDHGKDYEGVAGNGTINKLVLSKGSFEVSIAKLVRSHAAPRVDAKTCSFTQTVIASIPIVKGSGKGAYAGITGTIKVTITEAGILPKLKSGTCNESQSAPPVAGVSWAKGSGTVSFK
jgi:hypothetical protein